MGDVLAVRNAPTEFDAYRTSYSDAVNQAISFSGLDVDFFTRAKSARLLDWLSQEIGALERLSVLDVGCGIGNYHPLLHGRLGQLTGVDPSEECIAEARVRNDRVSYEVSDGDALPFSDSTFDAAFAICVMHHVPPAQWSLFSSEMARVVRPGGAVLIYEHNPYNPLTQRIVSNCVFDRDAVLLKKKQVETYLRSAGLKDVMGRYILTVPSVDGALRRLDEAFGLLPIGAQYFVAAKKA